MPYQSENQPETTSAQGTSRNNGSSIIEETGSDFQRSSAYVFSNIQTQLTVGSPDDIYEKEADAVADQVMRMPDCNANEPLVQYGNGFKGESTFFQRKCAECEREELQKKSETYNITPFIQAKSQTAGPINQSLANEILSSQGKGSAMDAHTHNFMSDRFGADFSRVQIHTDQESVNMNNSLQAKAFTLGNDIYFNDGQYQPGSDSGKRLLAHELTHVIQQNGRVERQIQRTTHSGSACNCHNWLTGLPPWIAGTFAHSQIAALLLAGGIHPQAIPRATKVLRGLPSPPSGTPFGFADLWKDNGSNINIAEIKSTAAGDAAARPEAAHYIFRHDEWLGRLGTGAATDTQDTLYGAMVGGPKIGGTLDISSITGTGLPIGPFIADPTKLLWVEGDATGSVVYWCTGLLDPVLMALLAAAIAALKKMLELSKRIMEEALVLAKAAMRWLAENWEYVVLAILIIVAIVLIIIFAEAILAFLAAVAAAVVTALEAAAAALAVAFAGLESAIALLALVGVELPGAIASADNLKNGLLAMSSGNNDASGSDYERNTGNESIPSLSAPSPGAFPNQASALAAALAPLANPLNLYEAAKNSSSARSPHALAAIRQGIGRIALSGNTTLADSLSETLNQANS
jgi:hypothetical protein